MKPFAINFLAYTAFILSIYFGFEVFSVMAVETAAPFYVEVR